MMLLDSIPVWLLIGVVACGVLLSIEIGYRVGRYRAASPKHEVEAPVGTIVGAILGLLAFILAFTFGMAANQFEARREMVVEEANAIGTAYLRANLLPDDQSTKVQQLITQYVDVRLEIVERRNVEEALAKSDGLHRQLWREVETASRLQPGSVPVGLFTEAVNSVIDEHAKRIQVGLRNRLPPLLWIVLLMLTFLAMAGVGYQGGLIKSIRSPATFVLIVSFSIIIGLIADLDTPQDGALVVSQEALVKLREFMQSNR